MRIVSQKKVTAYFDQKYFNVSTYCGVQCAILNDDTLCTYRVYTNEKHDMFYHISCTVFNPLRMYVSGHIIKHHLQHFIRYPLLQFTNG